MQSLVISRSQLLDGRRRTVNVAQCPKPAQGQAKESAGRGPQQQADHLNGLEQAETSHPRPSRPGVATAVYGPEPLESDDLTAAKGIGWELRSQTVAGLASLTSVRIRSAATQAAARAPALAPAHLDTVAAALARARPEDEPLSGVVSTRERLGAETPTTVFPVGPSGPFTGTRGLYETPRDSGGADRCELSQPPLSARKHTFSTEVAHL
jgi:hypothetical protein